MPWTSRWEGARGKVRDQLRVPLLRNAYSLVASQIATSGLGVLFWILAAHRYSTGDVGLGTALISAMQLLSGLAQLNLSTAFNRFVPTAGRATRRLVGIGYAATVTLSAVAALVFLAGTHVGAWTPKLVPLLAHGWDGALFVFAVMMWTVFTLEDAVLTGLGEAPFVLVENVSYGILKLGLLWFVASRLPHTGIFVAWTLPLLLCVAGVNRLLFARLIPRRQAPPHAELRPSTIARFASADYVTALLATATTGLIPIIVLGVAGKQATAYVFYAFTISYTLFSLALGMGQAMITEVAQAPDRLVEHARRAVKHSLALVVPAALGLAVAAPWVLRVFGTDYSQHATRVTQLFALSAIPGVFVVMYVAIMRARRAIGAVVLVTFVQSVGTLGLMEVLLHAMGITGVGVAWLVVQSAIGGFLFLGELRTLWLPYVRPATLRDLAGRARLTTGSRPHRAALKLGVATLEASPLVAQGWELEEFVADKGDVCKLGLVAPASGARAILSVATSETGAGMLRREAVTLGSLEQRSPRPLADFVPRVLATGAQPRVWTLETRCPGVTALGAVDRPVELDALIADVVDKLGAFYAVGAEAVAVDEAAFERLVDAPLAAAGVLNTTRLRMASDAHSLAKVRSELHAALVGGTVTMSLTHGNLWLGSVLWEPQPVAATGLVDWNRARTEPPAVDVTHLLCTTRALVERREVGAVVRDALASGALAPSDEDLLRSLPGAGDISTRNALLLAWLRHISDNATRAPRLRTHQVWLEHNVHQVLEGV